MNWPLPPYESQYSALTHVDAENCIPESLCHIIYMMTGFRGSPRALAKQAGVNQNGSTVSIVLATINAYGLIPYEKWPSPETFTWNEYYAPIPPEVLATAKIFNVRLIQHDLNKSPIWTQLIFPNGGGLHFVAQYDPTQYFDSERGAPVKNLSYNGAVVGYQTSIQLIQKRMAQIKQQNKGGELRLVLSASSVAEWNALCAVYGLDPAHIDETL